METKQIIFKSNFGKIKLDFEDSVDMNFLDKNSWFIFAKPLYQIEKWIKKWEVTTHIPDSLSLTYNFELLWV